MSASLSLEDIQRHNLRGLVGRFFETQRTETARTLLANLPPGGLGHLLRHHDEESITDQAEIEARDSFDFLLGFYSLIEIATIGDHVPSEVRPSDRSRWLGHLAQKDVRRYYEEHYSLVLPMLLRQRLEGARSALVIAASKRAQANSMLMEFLTFISDRNGDPDTETFLWFMDEGSEGGVSWKHVAEALHDLDTTHDVLASRPSDPRQAADPLARGLVGLFKFLSFCSSFARFLRRAEALDRPLAAAFWHLHSYWFDAIADTVAPRIREAVRAMTAWVGSQGGASSGQEIMTAVEYLLDHERGTALLSAADKASRARERAAKKPSAASRKATVGTRRKASARPKAAKPKLLKKKRRR